MPAKTIDIIVTRHEEKSKLLKPTKPGDETDRDYVPLSDKGLAKALETGKSELTGETPIARAVLITSDFLRAQQTGHNILAGAGYDLGKNKDRSVVAPVPQIGLYGVNWEVSGLPKYGDTPEELSPWVTELHRKYFLRHGEGADPKNPVMSERAALMAGNVAAGLEDLATKLSVNERGALVVVTHAGTIDAMQLAIAYGKPPVKTTENGTEVEIPDINAHGMGEFIKGKLVIEEGQSAADASIYFKVKGQEYSMKLSELKARAQAYGQLAQTVYQKPIVAPQPAATQAQSQPASQAATVKA